MKINKRWYITTLIAIGLLLASVANTFASEHSWASVRESKWQGALIDIYFVDQQHGWIVGSGVHNLAYKRWREQLGQSTEPTAPIQKRVSQSKVYQSADRLDRGRGRHYTENS